MPVDSQHPQYRSNVPKWILIRDVVNSDVKQYIKDIDPTDPSRSTRYRDDAQFTNFSGRTKNGLVGAMFRRDPLIELPSSVEYLQEDATGANESLTKFAQEITSEVVQTGRFGILTDFPVIAEGLTAKELEDNDIKARFSKYPAESIINWKEERIHGNLIITLVVLREVLDEIDPEDGFQWEEKINYRVLQIIDGVYVQSVYDEEGKVLESNIPLDANGNSWEKIPFEFVGAEDNDAQVDAAPLYDLSRLNIGHLRNSADYEESVHITGQPTLVISSNLDKSEFDEMNPNGVQIGARRGLFLGPGGASQLLQATPNQLSDEAMKRKEQQAVMIGARLITPQATNETAEAARMRHSGETSILSNIAHNIEEALIRSVHHCIRFMDESFESISDDDITLELNDQFFDANLDPNMIMAQVQLAQQGIITKTDIRNTLRKFGHLQDTRTDSDIENDPAKLMMPESITTESPDSDDNDPNSL